jgi:DNA excision repair protein ERCC-4
VTGDARTILVDHRERGSGVPEALLRLGLSTEVLALEVGDYIVAEGVGAERKTVPDLHRCIANRRLWRQWQVSEWTSSERISSSRGTISTEA